MKRILTATAFAPVTFGPALAADLPASVYTKAPTAAVAPVYNWGGFYVGAHAGAGWGNSDWDFLGFNSRTRHSISGALAGGQLGYNYQVGRWVLGIEGEGSWANLTGDSRCPNPTAICSSKIDWMTSVTGRLGYTWNNAMLYAKGGGVWAGERHNVTFGNPASNETTGDMVRNGYTIGAGLEYVFAPNWSAKVEYMYSNLGHRDADFSRIATGVFVEAARFDEQIHTAKVGVNYHFNWGNPVVARH